MFKTDINGGNAKICHSSCHKFEGLAICEQCNLVTLLLPVWNHAFISWHLNGETRSAEFCWNYLIAGGNPLTGHSILVFDFIIARVFLSLI